MRFGGIEIRSGVDRDSNDSFIRVGWHQHRALPPPGPAEQMIRDFNTDRATMKRKLFYGAPRNRREIAQAMADLPRRERRRLIRLAAREKDRWAVPHMISTILFAASFLAPTILAAILFIVQGLDARWDMFAERELPIFLRAIMVTTFAWVAVREATVWFARPTQEELHKAWKKLYGDD